ncbi:hypothetical protein KSP39_PZI007321 [Platanthera zijinensis]|uniref:Endonuclease/exonuclease/phosphatase domain-containing protein n=1 Tax=Platanthera zijinensis TaxID=2320716 RepID=A0AAP0BQ27_9ASPA
MLKAAGRGLRRLCGRIRWRLRVHRKVRVSINGLAGRLKPKLNVEPVGVESLISRIGSGPPPIRIATFNAAMFSMAPAVPTTPHVGAGEPSEYDLRCKSVNDRPRSILKQLPGLTKPKLRVSINLPDNEIERRSRRRISGEGGGKGKGSTFGAITGEISSRSVLDVLREVGADIIGLQNVKAEEEKGMRPLSDLAAGLGMKYVFAESWAPEYGNAVLSRFPIKRWRVQKVFDDSDFRNVMKTTIEVPRGGEVNFQCTHLDHLDENWRMKQINTILKYSDGPHILAGGLNALDETDYSAERWSDIVKYHEEIGKPSPKVEVMKYLKEKHYMDAKSFAGECEAVVVLAKGQDVQGTCKYGTRVDYILSSAKSPYKFVPGSYEVLSSKGTSDHHIVKVDIVVIHNNIDEKNKKHKQKKKKKKQRSVVLETSSKGLWRTNHV